MEYWKLSQNQTGIVLSLHESSQIKAKLFSSQGHLLTSWNKYSSSGGLVLNTTTSTQKTFLRINI